MPVLKVRYLWPILLLLVVSSFWLFIPKAQAIFSCSASVSPTSVGTSTSSSLTFSVANEDSEGGNVIWIKITAPSGFSITGGNASEWSTSVSSSQIIFEGGNLSSSSSSSFTVNVTTGSTSQSASDFTIEVSDSSGGGNPVTCGGSTSVSIISLALSSFSVSDIGNSSARVNWSTNESSNSTVQYGTTTGYGSSKSDSSQATSHSLEITGLSANTTYHYKIQSTDSGGNTAETSDNTFVTARSSTTTTVTTTTTTTTTVTRTAADTITPITALTTDFSKVYTEAPKITGTASDNVGITKVEYSIDNGANWLPVDSLDSIGAKSASFSFTPIGLEDGNYKIRIKATDPSGNQIQSRLYTLIIDRLPPLVGSTLISFGPQILKPTKEGVILTLMKLDQKITLSAIGGPVSIDLVSNQVGRNGSMTSLNGRQVFSMVKNPDNGLWFGTLSFSEPGIHQLETKSIDGADNRIERELNTIVVLPLGRVTDGKKVIYNTQVSLYYFEPTTRSFVLWDGKPFSQENPQMVDSDGYYKLLLPAGRYYLEISAPLFKSVRTDIFSLTESTPINSDFVLKKVKRFNLGPISFSLPDLKKEKLEIKISYPSLANLENQIDLTGKEFPYFSFPSGGKYISSSSFRGKPTIFTFMTTWSPQISEQLVTLDELIGERGGGINVAVLMGQETASKVDIFKKAGGYKVPIFADRDGQLTTELNILNLPTHVFLDRKGTIKNISSGVLSKDELLENLLN